MTAFEHREQLVLVWPSSTSLPCVTFWIRNATGSIFAACASSSITCSPANVACGPLPARIQCALIQLPMSGSDFTR